jgi:hypothetical protein
MNWTNAKNYSVGTTFGLPVALCLRDFSRALVSWRVWFNPAERTTNPPLGSRGCRLENPFLVVRCGESPDRGAAQQRAEQEYDEIRRMRL